MKALAAFALFAFCSATPAMAVELYHCTVNGVSDGFFNTIDLKVDGTAIDGSTTIYGHEKFFGAESGVFAYFYKGENGSPYLTVMYQEGRERTESISFSLQDVVSRLGQANRYTAKEGFGQIESTVEMICDMAVPI